MTLRLVRTEVPPELPERPRRRWRDRLRDACRGIKIGVRGQASFFVHFFVATLALVAAVVLQCEWPEWCALAGCVGLVLTAELINSAIAALSDALDSVMRDRPTPARQIASGAVLIANSTALFIGMIVLGRRLWVYLS